ncbi:MAG: hypothetical protein BYD32DRAFT_453052 [Podila humilis]|nr:MAG: hypothetical protein BYD32DRAFT_453052 [Podila humilis]
MMDAPKHIQVLEWDCAALFLDMATKQHLLILALFTLDVSRLLRRSCFGANYSLSIQRKASPCHALSFPPHYAKVQYSSPWLPSAVHSQVVGTIQQTDRRVDQALGVFCRLPSCSVSKSEVQEHHGQSSPLQASCLSVKWTVPTL